MLSFLHKCILPAVVAAGVLGFSTIPFARADSKHAVEALHMVRAERAIIERQSREIIDAAPQS